MGAQFVVANINVERGAAFLSGVEADPAGRLGGYTELAATCCNPALLSPLPPEQLASVPITGLVGIEAPDRLRGLMQAGGAAAFLSKPGYSSTVYAALFFSVNPHSLRRRSAEWLAEHAQRRRGRHYLIRATIRLMEQKGWMTKGPTICSGFLRCARGSVEEYCQAWRAVAAPANTIEISRRIA